MQPICRAWMLTLLLLALPACGTEPAAPTAEPTTGATASPTPTTLADAGFPPATQPLPTEGAVPTDPLPNEGGLSGGDLVGPDWRITYNGDMNQDGQRDVVASIPAEIALAPEMQQYAIDYPVLAAEIQVVQEGEDGQPVTLLTVNRTEMRADDRFLGAFTSDGMRMPGAFLLQVDEGSDTPIAIIPVSETGEAYAQGVGFTWDDEQQTYRLALGGEGASEPPLVDSYEWHYAYQGDINADGLRDVVASIPSAISPDQDMQASMQHPPAREITIIQEGETNRPRTLLRITPDEIRSGGSVLIDYGASGSALRPAAFLMQINEGAEVAFSVVPMTATGSGYGQGVGLLWDAEQQRYVVAGAAEGASPSETPAEVSPELPAEAPPNAP